MLLPNTAWHQMGSKIIECKDRYHGNWINSKYKYSIILTNAIRRMAPETTLRRIFTFNHLGWRSTAIIFVSATDIILVLYSARYPEVTCTQDMCAFICKIISSQKRVCLSGHTVECRYNAVNYMKMMDIERDHSILHSLAKYEITADAPCPALMGAPWDVFCK